ncbi:hypothetical protein [Xanthomonas sp. GPE 39]|uniref:hypothetical protein n=1 Tax=Xanthomonas sp. GPE 39 TaxID=1583099 RepID=UPI0005F27A88|nr:hypothetical protein [Xanthomonas sp. GPE 39]
MSDAIADRRIWTWRIYLVLALLFGVPPAIVGGAITLIGAIVTLFALLVSPQQGPIEIFIWSVAGLVGVVTWCRLSYAYLWWGLRQLRQVSIRWYVGLLIGIGAALLIVWLRLQAVFSDQRPIGVHPLGWDDLIVILVGPGLIIPALYLLWLRLISCRKLPIQ